MPLITGKQLDEVVEEMTEWYTTTRQWLMERLEEGGYAYGNIKLTQAQQIQRVAGWTAEDWQALYRKRLDRYRGLPDANERAKKDVQNFLIRMARLMQGAQL